MIIKVLYLKYINYTAPLQFFAYFPSYPDRDLSIVKFFIHAALGIYKVKRNKKKINHIDNAEQIIRKIERNKTINAIYKVNDHITKEVTKYLLINYEKELFPELNTNNLYYIYKLLPDIKYLYIQKNTT